MSQNDSLTIGKIHRIQSEILGEERILNIYLPADYSVEDSLEYPVIYVLDGGMDEDFFHVCGIVQFNNQPWIARFPNSIVVGIGGNMRRRDFTHAVDNYDFLQKAGKTKADFPAGSGSSVFIAALENEIIPFVDSTYKTSAHRTVLGESLGGLLCTELLVRHPMIFDDYIIITPSLWWGDGLLIREAERNMQNEVYTQKKIYIAACNKDEDEMMFEVADKLFQSLRKADNGAKIYFDYLENEYHSTVMHQAVYNAFRKFYPKTVLGK